MYLILCVPLACKLADALKAADRDKETRVIVLTGAGKAFSSGQDLGDLKKKYVPGHVPHLGDDLKKRYDPVIKRIRSTGKPVMSNPVRPPAMSSP